MSDNTAFVQRKVYYNSSIQVPQKQDPKLSYLYNYKPKESNYQRQILEELIVDAPDDQIKQQAVYLKEHTKQFLRPPTDPEQSLKLQEQLHDRLALLRQKIQQVKEGDKIETRNEAIISYPKTQDLNPYSQRLHIKRANPNKYLTPNKPASFKLEPLPLEQHEYNKTSEEDVNSMKRALSQYHIQMRKDYSQMRADVIEQEREKIQEARVLVKSIKAEKDQRINNQRKRIQRLLFQKAAAFDSAVVAYESLRSKSKSLESDKKEEHWKSSGVVVLNSNRRTPNLVPLRNKYKQAQPLYVEIQRKYEQKQKKSQDDTIKQMRQMKAERKFMDMESLADHQYRYDQMLRQRAYLGDDLFKQRTTPKRDTHELDIMGDIRVSRNSLSPYRRNLQIVQDKKDNKRIVSEHDRKNVRLKAKEDRRLKYAQYIKELNLPFEFDRAELMREAQRLKAEQYIRIAHYQSQRNVRSQQQRLAPSPVSHLNAQSQPHLKPSQQLPLQRNFSFNKLPSHHHSRESLTPTNQAQPIQYALAEDTKNSKMAKMHERAHIKHFQQEMQINQKKDQIIEDIRHKLDLFDQL